VLLAVLESLDAPGPARKALRDLSTLPPPPDVPPALARRISWIRCAAAAVLAGADFREPLLLACDITPPPAVPPPPAGAPPPRGGDLPAASIGARAVVRAMGRAEITGARLAAWRAYAEGGERRVRQAAIELIASHPEIEGAPAVLAKALASEEPGFVGVAAEVIAKQPQRAGEPEPQRRRGKKARRGAAGAQQAAEKPDAPGADPSAALAPSPAVVSALLAAVERAAARNDPELADAVIDAAGALALKQAEPRLEALCRSTYPTTREHAQKALALIRGKAAACEAPGPGEAPAEIGALAPGPITLTLDTDAGEVTLTLDPALAPVAVARVAALARAGYYDGMVVHRVAPGFVTQFGAPFGDGYGGPPGKPALRCETSPLPFEPLRVGVALAGRDTGSSQLFVMHARAPHLDGQYALVGAAAGPWAAFVDGDIIRKVTVRE
jgi:cyclophilin family peptidyl-prolyl cis-trans isomerase